jgi:hypothetical protein
MFSRGARKRVGLKSTPPELEDLKQLFEKIKEEKSY